MMEADWCDDWGVAFEYGHHWAPEFADSSDDSDAEDFLGFCASPGAGGRGCEGP